MPTGYYKRTPEMIEQLARARKVHIKRATGKPTGLTGDKSGSWKGKQATYGGFHERVNSARGKPKRCEDCGRTDYKRYEWANLTGNYWDVNDYKRMCVRCHRRMDGNWQSKKTHCKNGHEFSEKNTRVWKDNKLGRYRRTCRACHNEREKKYLRESKLT